jgi:hypothetical protein
MILIKVYKSFILQLTKHMRPSLAVYACLLGFLFNPQNGKAEDIKNVKVNAQFSNVTVESALQLLQRRCNYIFTYNAELLPKKKTITASFSNKPLTDVLDFVLNNTGLNYTAKNKYILILPAAPSPPSRLQNKITGIVKDTTGAPLPGVTVLVTGKSRATTTNKEACFYHGWLSPERDYSWR